MLRRTKNESHRNSRSHLVPSVIFAADVDDVRQVVQKFYTATTRDRQASGFTQPRTGITSIRTAVSSGVRGDVLKAVREVHTTFLKGVAGDPADIRSHFNSRDVAIATVVSNVSAFKGPDGVTLAQHKNVRTFVVVRTWSPMVARAGPRHQCRYSTRLDFRGHTCCCEPNSGGHGVKNLRARLSPNKRL